MSISKVYTDSDLPRRLIGLNSSEGQVLLKQSKVLNAKLIDLFKKQDGDTYCGPASLALLMNSLNLGYHVKFQSVTRNSCEENQLMNDLGSGLVMVTEKDIVNAPNTVEFLKTTQLESDGLTLSELATLTMLCGLGVNTYFVYTDHMKIGEDKKNELLQREKLGDQYVLRSVGEFRTLVKSFLTRPLTGLIMNYDMSCLGYDLPFGHFSPLAGYDEESDKFLIVDVWPNVPSIWVSSEDLFTSLATVDDASGLPRGFLHIHELL